jgi:tripartite-type tricarboxylate transporter receptor subunit TctC
MIGTATRRGLLGATLALPALAQASWSPTRPVRFMVGFPPGGSADLLTRKLADGLGQALGQTVVVENRPGAGANIAMQALAQSPPDGQTIALGPVGPHAISPALMGARMPYDAARDFTPIIHVWDQPNVIVGGLSVPGDIPGFLAWLRGRPEEPYASVGAGTSNHLTGALLSHRLGLRLQHVPYRGSAAALTAIMGGEIRLFVDNVTTTIPLAREGRVRALAVSTARRSASLPDVPTLAEAVHPDLVISSWQGVFGPAGLPEPILARYNREIARMLTDPAMVEWMRGIGAEPAGGTPQGFAAFLATERERWARVVRETGVTIE